MGDRMSQLHYAVVTLQETYGGPEEGGWWKEIGIVEMLVTVDTFLDFGMREEYMEEEHINEVWEKGKQVKEAAHALGIKEDKEDGRFIGVVRLYNEYDTTYLETSDFEHPVNWRPQAEKVSLGDIIPVDCPFYC
jgi:hypothetical protein